MLIANISALKALDPSTTSGQEVVLEGYYTPADGGGGLFFWDTSSIPADNGGTIIASIVVGYTTIGRWRRIYSGALNIQWFGVKGDGTDETTLLQNVFSIGENVNLEEGRNYFINNTLNIKNPLVLNGNNSRIFNTNSHFTLISLESNDITICNLEIQGAGNASFNVNGFGLRSTGLYNSFYLNLIIENCFIHGFGRYGIYLNYCDHVLISNTKVHDIGYGGIMGISVSNVSVINNCWVKGISPGSAGNGYCIAFTRKGGSSDFITDPRSINCIVDGSLLEDNTIWEALDTHAGENISFINNRIRNCKTGIAIVDCPGAEGAGFGPIRCSAIGNQIDGIGTGHGIVVSGALSGTNILEQAQGCIVEDNQLFKCGIDNNANAGAIQLIATESTCIAGNTLKNCFTIGICLNGYNNGASITGNAVVDVQSKSISNASGIAFKAANNNAAITGNTFLRQNIGLNTYVMVWGILCSTATGQSISLGLNSANFNTIYSGLSGVHVDYGQVGLSGTKIVSSNISPEGIFAAMPGSFCYGTNGRAYVKEINSAAVGWRQVNQFLETTKTYDPPAIASMGIATTTVTITAALGDVVSCSFNLDLQNLMMSAYVSANNLVTVIFFNPTASSIDIDPGTLKIRVSKT